MLDMGGELDMGFFGFDYLLILSDNGRDTQFF